MEKNLKILITGGAGYIGSVVTQQMLESGHMVICVDKLNFGASSLLSVINHENFKFFKCDIANYESFKKILSVENPDAVIHLAAIVGDPACSLYPEQAHKVNWEASKWLADTCKDLGINRFIFASTCSNYGKMGDGHEYVSEKSALAPVSLYAELKVKLENYLLNEMERSKSFIPTALRFSTVYGLSPRMRFDLTVNEFTKELFQGNELVVFGEQFWRPYCHVKDFARAFEAVLNSPKEKVAYNVFNVGDTAENYTKQMIVDVITEVLPKSVIRYVKKTEDPRDYRVNFDKIKNNLGFEVSRRVPDGVREIVRALSLNVITDTEEQVYYNIPHKKEALV
jgi:nucleoside-diphosphate-sugar epimerase